MNQENSNTKVKTELIEKKVRGQRKFEILQNMAQMLQTAHWQKITTAALAEKIGFSEAALYRHYTGKAQMFEGLIDFIDKSIIAVFKQIENNSDSSPLVKIKLMVECLLVFAANNPGLTRVLTGEALQNEDELLQKRLMAILTRIEENWKILFREAILAHEVNDALNITLAPLLLNYIIGCWWRFSKSGFNFLPDKNFNVHWELILRTIR